MCIERLHPASAPAHLRGFTLLEVIVALAIAALAFTLLFHAGSTGLFAADTAGRAQEAVERAQSHLAAIGRDATLVAGNSQGDDGGGFRWHIAVRPIASRRILAPGAGSFLTTTLYDVTVAISWKSRGRERRVALKTRRIETKAGE